MHVCVCVWRHGSLYVICKSYGTRGRGLFESYQVSKLSLRNQACPACQPASLPAFIPLLPDSTTYLGPGHEWRRWIQPCLAVRHFPGRRFCKWLLFLLTLLLALRMLYPQIMRRPKIKDLADICRSGTRPCDVLMHAISISSPESTRRRPDGHTWLEVPRQPPRPGISPKGT